MLLRLPDRVSEPIFVDRLVQATEQNDGVTLVYTDEPGEFEIRLEITGSTAGLRFSLTAEGPSPIWMTEWTLGGLDLAEVIIPALGGQAVDSGMPPGERLSFKYPFWWNAQFVIGRSSHFEGGLWLRTLDERPRFKMLRVSKAQHGLFDVTLGIEADAPLRREPLAGAWYINAYAGSWKAPVDSHRAWMTSTFQLRPYEEHPHFPAWAREVNLVFELWGMRKDAGRAAHTFADMEARLDAFSQVHPPRETLLYLPGFAEGGIDSQIPSYNPSSGLGGAEGFKSLVDHAHALGYHVMIHTNVLGMSYAHPLYERFARYQVVDVFERRQGWAMDVDGDWLTEPYFAYMNPGETAWTDLMIDTLGRLIREYGLDAVFLDQTLLAFNVASGPNFLEGMRRHVEKLQQAFPNVLFGGEGLNDYIQPSLPFAQIHGIDSVAGVHAMEESRVWRRPHPVSTHLFGPSTLFAGHLLTKHPSHPLFAAQEAAYETLGIVPTLVCYDSGQDLSSPVIDRLLERARSFRGETTAIPSGGQT